MPKPAVKMASEEELINRTAHREVLRSFSLSNTKTSEEQNLRHACTHHDSLMCQQVATEDAPEMARLLDAEMQSVEQIIEEEQAHRVQVAALSQMQLQAMERVAEQERELRRLSNLMAEHQAILRTSPERPQPQSPSTSPPNNLARLRDEIHDVLPGTVNTVRGAVDRVGQVPDLGNLPTFRKDTLNDILEEQQEEEVPVTPQRWVGFETSTPIVRPVEWPRERIQPSKVSQVPSLEKSLPRYPEARDLFEEGFSQSLQAAATEFKKLCEPKVAKFKGGYSSDASLVFQSWLKDIRVYTIERHCLSQQEAIQLVKDYTSEQARSEVEYYLGLTPEQEQSFQGLIEHLSLAFQSCKTVSSLIADFYNWCQRTRETEDAFTDELQILVRKIIARKPEFIHEANQALKHQFAQNLRDPYFGVVARGQCLSSHDSESFMQFRGRLALMFNSLGNNNNVLG